MYRRQVLPLPAVSGGRTAARCITHGAYAPWVVEKGKGGGNPVPPSLWYTMHWAEVSPAQ